MSNPIKIFISYAHEDEKYKDKIIMFFKPKIICGEVEIWHDRDISEGDLLHEKIQEKLNTAHAIIMLISPHFLASEYINSKEFKIALERHKDGNARAFGIVVEDSDWLSTELNKFLLFPKDAKPIETFPRREVNTVYNGIINKITKITGDFLKDKENQTGSKNPPNWSSNSSGTDEVKTYQIPMPDQKIAYVDEEFFKEAMPLFAKSLYIFTLRSEEMIAEQKKTYNWQGASQKDKVHNLIAFLQSVCRDVNKIFFHWGGVRSHFRFFHGDKIHKKKKGWYFKLAAAMGGADWLYALTPMPSEQDGMIYHSILCEQPLTYGLNPDWHFDKDGKKNLESRNFKDYITFTLMDDSLLYQKKCLLSMGISFEIPDDHRNLYYIMSLCRFDKVIADVLKSYATATNIDVRSMIIENRDYIYELFYKDYVG